MMAEKNYDILKNKINKSSQGLNIKAKEYWEGFKKISENK